MTNKTELLPCPFCGAQGIPQMSNRLIYAFVDHDDFCPMSGSMPTLEKWNTRAPAEDVPSEEVLIAAGLGYPLSKEAAHAAWEERGKPEPLTDHPQNQHCKGCLGCGHDQYGYPCAVCVRPAEDVRAVGEEPVRLTAVATLRDDGDGGLEADWLLEGGTSELSEGMILLVAENDPTLCEEDGSAEVYRHPQRPVVLPTLEQFQKWKEDEKKEHTPYWAWRAAIDAVEELNK